jgi:hypothetical protein
MKELTIVVGILVFILAIAIVFSIFQLMDENRKLRADVRDKQTRIDELMSRPSMVGLTYKSDKETIKSIMNSISEMFDKSKDVVCKQNKDTIAASTATYVDWLIAQKKSCKELQTESESFVDMVLAGTTVSDADKTALKTAIKKPYELIMTASCKDDKVDKTLMVQLLTDMWDALCKA